MKQTFVNKGFTLLELLVVIAIIGILSALLLPAVNGVRKKGHEAKAKSELKALETAVKAYITEYAKLPVKDELQGKDDLDTDDTESKDVIQILIGNNPRKILFLESQNEDGTFNDPWNRQYKMILDTDYNNVVSVITNASKPAKIVHSQVVIYSQGDKGTNKIYSFNL